MAKGITTAAPARSRSYSWEKAWVHVEDSFLLPKAVARGFPTTYPARSCHANCPTLTAIEMKFISWIKPDQCSWKLWQERHQQISSFTASKGNEIFPEGSGESRKKHIDAQHQRQLRTLEEGQRCNENQREDGGKHMGVDQRCGKSSGFRKKEERQCKKTNKQTHKHLKHAYLFHVWEM